ncbi:4Fe-4S ferredoxin iron-sulfur binding domain protein [Candidatus Vecturithrix granuli]|uniref:4Fe-4S ferredoxin iron-sulfur binding domain protein n=1 Tax=Vecturithrix granuli TaxID=1499967 RepID=A0A081C7L2_VECG1|nr:4Fe-4S ferredoxin iron-sulfur binding domain protein [Candidatus Vecturithrix granuli]
MQQVYFTPIASYHETAKIRATAKNLLQTVVEKEQITLQPHVSLKVHFGEKGNTTFIGAQNFEGVIEYLHGKQVQSSFIETNALYRGERTTRTTHIRLAKEHGFTQIPIIIADGEHGEDYEEVEINQKHFRTCKIGTEIAQQKQMIVISHFKGHLLAGFGGAIKQLAMGCAARGGKLEQHANAIPLINPLTCKKCRTCVPHCPAEAIQIGWLPRINSKKCIGCASCLAICPFGAISLNPLRASFSTTFYEKLAEYALAAHKEKNNIYLSFALNITKNCDCNGRSMKSVVADLGILASTDPVALDQACLDLLDQRNGKKVFSRGRHTLDYGQKIGLGSTTYELKRQE